MDATAADCLEQLESRGYFLLRRVFSPHEVDEILGKLAAAFASSGDEQGAIRSGNGTLCAARNLLDLWPRVATIWQIPALAKMLGQVLGGGYGLVRVLYFDKPPDHNWALPWHKDLTIAVRDNSLPTHRFGRPTRKAGVPHVIAPQEILEQMLTARIHLDDVTEENGPLKVIPGSHRAGLVEGHGDEQPHTILAWRGDVLLIRPLVEHCSGHSDPDTRSHRRILHLEFSGLRHLPDGYEWHDFIEPDSGWAK